MPQLQLRLVIKMSAANDDLFAFVTQVLTDKGHFVTEAQLRGYGLDLLIAEKMFEQEVRPRLKYLHGYKPLGELPELTNENSLGSVRAMVRMYADIRVVSVLNRQRHKNGYGRASEIKVWLARDGRWFVWTVDYISAAQQSRGNVYADGPNETEKLQLVDTLAEVCGVIDELMDGDSGLGGLNSSEYAKYAPLIIEQELRNVLANTINSQKSNLDSIKSALVDATKRTSMIRYY